MKENRIHQLTGKTCIKIEFYYRRINTISLTEKTKKMRTLKFENINDEKRQ